MAVPADTFVTEARSHRSCSDDCLSAVVKVKPVTLVQYNNSFAGDEYMASGIGQ
ncbi:MAG: hypothetical protein MZV63_29705 [Marinilabiliales bacterium]|nr:hypothetical protein [Marinilabiliales bacterium]